MKRLIVLVVLALSALAAPVASASPLTPPPPSTCGVALTYTPDLLTAGTTNDSTYHLTIITHIDGEFDSNTGQLCDLRARSSWKNTGSSNYGYGGAEWVCITTSAANCTGTDIAASYDSWGGTLVPLATEVLDGPWVGTSRGQCVSNKKFGTTTAWGNPQSLIGYGVDWPWC